MPSTNTQFKKGQIPWNKGLTKQDPRVKKYGENGSITKQKLSKEGKLPPIWNKGLTKNDDIRLQNISRAMSVKRKGSKLSEGWKKSMSKAYREQYQNGERKWWGLDPKNKEIWKRVKKNFGSKEAQLKAFQANSKHTQNKLEKYFQSILDKNFPNEWIFTGDGSQRIGRKFPDFTHITKKQVILVNGVFWHIKFLKREHLSRKEIEILEKEPYEKEGYTVLHFWEDELISRTRGGKPIYDKNIKLILDKIMHFDIK